MSRDDYLYSAGVIRFLENKLLDQTDVERMVDAPDLEQAFKVFHDTDYYDNVLDVEPADFIKALDADLEQVKNKLQEMTPNEKLVELLFMRYDFHNLKLAVKEKVSEKDFSQYYTDLGIESLDRLKDAVNGINQSDVKKYLHSALEAINLLPQEKGLSPAVSDRVIDQEYFKEYQKLSQSFKSSWLSDLVAWQIDIANIKIFLRSKLLGYSQEDILAETIPGGHITNDTYRLQATTDIEESIIALKFDLPMTAQIALENYSKNKSLEQLEKDLENFELDYIKQVKFIDYGPELPIAYYFAKKNAIRNIRLIMTGKLNDLKALEIKKLVREIY